MKIFKTFAISVIFLCDFQFFAQTAPNSPKMPEMPSSSFGGFYTPGSSGFFSGTKPTVPYIPNFAKNRVLTDSQRKKIQEDSEDFFGNAGEDSSKNRVLTDSQKKEIGEESIIGTSSLPNLTAKDLANLDSLGVLGKLSSVVNSNKLQSDNSKETLEQILQRLNEIKESLSENQIKAKNEISETPKILRFTADGVDWSNAVSDAHFSDEEADGTFLFTGDLKYSVSGQAKSETFYLLFKSAAVSSGVSYNVIAQTTSDDENTLASRIAKKTNLTANRTGNLISLRVADSDLKLDLLISTHSFSR